MAQQQPLFVIQSSAAAPVAQSQTGTGGYKTAAGRRTGVIQIVCGSLCIILGIANIFFSFFGVIGWAIWGGVVSISFYFVIKRNNIFSIFIVMILLDFFL